MRAETKSRIRIGLVGAAALLGVTACPDEPSKRAVPKRAKNPVSDRDATVARDADDPLVKILLLGGENIAVDENVAVIDLPNATLQAIFDAHSEAERVFPPELPAENDVRLTGGMAGIRLLGVARVTLTAVRGLNVVFGPQTRALIARQSQDGVILVVPTQTSSTGRAALAKGLALLKELEAHPESLTPNRLVLVTGKTEPAAAKAASSLGAQLVSATRPAELRRVLRSAVDRALERAAKEPQLRDSAH